VNSGGPVDIGSAPDVLGTSLRDYEHLKFELATLVRDTTAVLPTPRDPEIERELQLLLGHLADDQFNLVVLGQFNRGKTSLMNAVLGSDRLPTGIVPLTSVITVVRYGSHERGLVEYENSGLRHEISLADLPTYVTQEGNPGNEKRIRTVEIQLPAEVLRRGFRFIDTPGLGSAIAENTATTDRFLPETDAVVFVTSCDAPLSELEVEYLRTARRLVRKIFLVVNKMDLLRVQQREQVLGFIRERLAQQGLDELPIYALSAQEALGAKLARNDASLDASGIQHFERALVDFLVTDKSRDLLAQNCDRLVRIVTTATAGGNTELVTRIAAFRARIVGTESKAGAQMLFDASATAKVRRVCLVCQAAARRMADFFAKYQYDISHNRAEQHRHAMNHGFCSRHTWQYEKLASPRGVCSAYPAVLLAMRDELQTVANSTSKPTEAIPSILPSADKCIACKLQVEVEEEALHTLSDKLKTEESSMLCLRHLSMMLSKVDDEIGRSILKRHAAVMERIAEDMQRFVLKQDGLRRSLMSDDERQACHQGLALLAGDRRLVSSPEFEVWL
jgi:GTP-binding protein EngB required for normal cell division